MSDVRVNSNLANLGKPFDLCPSIRIFSDQSTFRKNLTQSSFAGVANDLAGDMRTAWEKNVSLTVLSSPQCYASRCALTEIDWYAKRGHFFVFILARDMNLRNGNLGG